MKSALAPAASKPAAEEERRSIGPCRASPGLALYVHWPFCLSKCPYCDFNSHVREAIDEARWRAALLAEIAHTAARFPRARLDSLYFGGGTPSLMAPELCATVIECAESHWPAAPDLEITLEANPSSAPEARLRAFRDAGVNRLSLGVQAFEDAALRFLGRRHDAHTARKTIERAQAIFPRFSFDLIYARPDQSAADWRAELARALGFAPTHLSLYQLTIEKGTPFYALQRAGALACPADEDAALLFETTQEVLDGAGLPAYEISNHAREGEACRHNLAYWRYQDYAGIGPGAHARLAEHGALLAIRRSAQPEAWLEQVERVGHGTSEERALERSDRIEEAVLMGLRTLEGIDAERFAERTGVRLENAVPEAKSRPLEDAGLIARDLRGLRASRAGRPVLNALIARLIA